MVQIGRVSGVRIVPVPSSPIVHLVIDHAQGHLQIDLMDRPLAEEAKQMIDGLAAQPSARR